MIENKHFIIIVSIFLSFGLGKINAQQLLPFDKEAKAKCLFQDSNQELWIGSSKGLFSYDGLTFKPFLPEIPVTAIFEDHHKRLWIGYENGEIRYLNNKGETELWNIEEGLPKAKITGFAESPNGNLWFSTYGEGVYYYHNKHLYNVNQDDGLPSDEVYDIAYADGAWVGTDGGASQIQIIDNQKNIKTLTTENGLGDNMVIGVKSVLGTPIFRCYDRAFDYSYNVYGDTAIIKEEIYSKVETTFQNEKIIFQTDNRSINWVITNKGIWCKNNSPFYKKETLPFKVQVHQQNVHDLEKGAFWGEYFGTSEGLFYRKLGSNEKINKVQLIVNQKVSVSCLTQDQAYTYVGTFSDGLFILDKLTQKIVKRITKKDGLCDNSVLSVFGNLVSTVGGLYEISSDFKIDDIGQKANIAIKYVYSIYKDGDKNIWLGTDGDGIIKIAPNFSNKIINNVNGKTVKTVYQIQASEYSKNIFFATPDLGVLDFDIAKNSFQIYNTSHGIRSNNINSLRYINQNLLLANENGIDVFSLEHQWSFPLFDKDLEQVYVPNLNIFDEHERDITLGNQVFYYSGYYYEPSLHFKTIKIFNQAIDYQRDTVFSHEQNYFNFALCGIYFPKPEALHFQYYLEGFDQQWIDTKEREISYPRLPAGEYVFHARALIGTYPSNEITYHFKIEPAFWKTSYFLISILILSVLGILFFVKLREKRLRKTAQLEQEKIMAQYDAIRSQVNPHFLFNTFNALIAVIENDAKQGVVFVEKLSDFFRNMLQHREKETIAINDEIALLQDYIYILKQRYSENISILSELKKVEGNIVPLTLQILVENAVKHNTVSKSKPLYISILIKENYIVIENNLQPKSQPETSTKFGLEGIVKRYALLSNKPVLVEKNEEKFIVKIPIL